MHAMVALCPRLWPIRPIWRCCIGAHAPVGTHTCTHTHAHFLCGRSQRQQGLLPFANPKQRLTSLKKKKSPAVTFIGGPPEPKRSSLQTKGQVCGGADISTSPSLTHSLQRQKDCIWLNRGWAAPSTVAAAV